MKTFLLVAACALGLAGIAGCGDSAPTQQGGGPQTQAPAPNDSGASKNTGVGAGRLPKK